MLESFAASRKRRIKAKRIALQAQTIALGILDLRLGSAAMKKASKKFPAKVRKIVTPLIPTEPEKAEIKTKNAEELYREIRVENKLTTDNGTIVRLKPGAEVEVEIEADEKSVEKK